MFDTPPPSTMTSGSNTLMMVADARAMRFRRVAGIARLLHRQSPALATMLGWNAWMIAKCATEMPVPDNRVSIQPGFATVADRSPDRQALLVNSFDPGQGSGGLCPHSPPMPCRYPTSIIPRRQRRHRCRGWHRNTTEVGPDRPHQPPQTARSSWRRWRYALQRSRRCSSICFTGLPFSATVFDPAANRSAAKIDQRPDAHREPGMDCGFSA